MSSVTKSTRGKGSVTSARVGKTHAPTGKLPPRGGRDSAQEKNSSAGGSTMKYTSGDVKRSSGSFKSYK
jgi:hypothetical protein